MPSSEIERQLKDGESIWRTRRSSKKFFGELWRKAKLAKLLRPLTVFVPSPLSRMTQPPLLRRRRRGRSQARDIVIVCVSVIIWSHCPPQHPIAQLASPLSLSLSRSLSHFHSLSLSLSLSTLLSLLITTAKRTNKFQTKKNSKLIVFYFLSPRL